MKRTITALALSLACWISSVAAQEEVKSNEALSNCDLIFAKLYKGYFSNNLMGDARDAVVSSAFSSKYRIGWETMTQEVRALSVAEQCRFALMAWLALPFDGEYANRFPDIFGNDKSEVFARLRKIPVNRLEEICASMGYPRERAQSFAQMLTRQSTYIHP